MGGNPRPRCLLLGVSVLQIVNLLDNISYLNTKKCQRSSLLGHVLENVPSSLVSSVLHSISIESMKNKKEVCGMTVTTYVEQFKEHMRQERS